MKIAELQVLRENRHVRETINQTYTRLVKEGAFPGEFPREKNKITLDRDITIPRYKIIHDSCRIEDATSGHFRNMLTEEEVPKLENIVFLEQQNSRSLFAKDDFSGVKSCWSYNGYIPAKDQILKKLGKEPLSEICANRENGKVVYYCPYACWRNELGEPDDNGKKQPLCKASIAFLGLDQNELPFWMVFHGSALPIVKNFLRYIKYRREQGKRQGNDLQLFDFRISIGLDRQVTPKGKYYTPNFEKKEIIISQDEREVLRQNYEALKGCFSFDPLEAENVK